MPALHQFVPTFEPGATGTHLLELQRLAREQGWRSEVFAEHVRPPYEGLAHRDTDYGAAIPAQPGDVLVYQMGIGSTVAERLLQRREPLVVNFHNLTPIEFFQAWEPEVVHGLAWGKDQLRRLAAHGAFGLADSAFNEGDMLAAGFEHTAVAPVLLDEAAFAGEPDAELLAALRAGKEAHGGADWLFVGRVAPNKCHHDLVKSFAAYRQAYDPAARLHLVGGQGPARYVDALRSFVTELGLDGAVRITGSVSPAALAAHYEAADVFVCLSEHEGFCVPLLEAWHHELPVVAFAAAAVPETLAAAGVLLHDKRPIRVAAAVRVVLQDGDLRRELAAAGRRRLAELSLERGRARMLEVLGPIVEGAAVGRPW